MTIGGIVVYNTIGKFKKMENEPKKRSHKKLNQKLSDFEKWLQGEKCVLLITSYAHVRESLERA